MRSLSLPSVLLGASLLSAQAAEPQHCDTFDRSITFEISAPKLSNGFQVSVVRATGKADIAAALADIDPNSLRLVHDAKGPGSSELLVARVNHDGDSHTGLGTFELSFDGKKSGTGWTVPGDSVVICRGTIEDPKVLRALQTAQ